MDDNKFTSGIYAITIAGQIALYHTESFGAPGDVLQLLHQVNWAGKRHPELEITDVDRMLLYSKSMIPITYYQPNRLFQPIGQESFDFLLGKIREGDRTTACYVLDYDQNRFALTSWDGDDLSTIKAPLQEFIDAYGRSLRKSSSTRTYLNEKAFSAELEKIATVEPVSASSNNPEQSEQGMVML